MRMHLNSNGKYKSVKHSNDIQQLLRSPFHLTWKVHLKCESCDEKMWNDMSDIVRMNIPILDSRKKFITLQEIINYWQGQTIHGRLAEYFCFRCRGGAKYKSLISNEPLELLIHLLF